MVEVDIKLYSIQRCGYYKNRNREVFKSSIIDLFDEVHEWGENTPFIDSYTVTPEEKNKTFLVKSFKSKSNDFYFMMWNSYDTNNKNAIYALPSNADYTNLAIENKKFKPGSIPGFPTYFWVSTSLETIATVRFNKSTNGHQKMTEFIKGFLSKNSKHLVRTKIGNNVEISMPIIDEEVLIPRFETRGIRNSVNYEKIKNNLNKVTKIKGKTHIIPDLITDNGYFDNLIEKIGGSTNGQSILQPFTFHYEFPAKITSNTLENIYDFWKDSDHSSEDIAFEIDGDLQWFGHSISKTIIDLNIKTLKNTEIFDLYDIMDKIELNKDEIVKRCKDEN